MEERGFTLIETLLALALVTILVTGAAELISLSLLLKRKADAHARAAGLLTEKLEGLRALPFDHANLAAGAYAEPITVTDGSGAFVREWEIEDISAGTKRIRVDIRNRAGSVARAVLFVSKDLGFGP